jgi:hypothetical protein
MRSTATYSFGRVLITAVVVFAVLLAYTAFAQQYVVLPALPSSGYVSVPCTSTITILLGNNTIVWDSGKIIVNGVTHVISSCSDYANITYAVTPRGYEIGVNGLAVSTVTTNMLTLGIFINSTNGCVMFYPGTSIIRYPGGIAIVTKPVTYEGFIYTEYGVCPITQPTISMPTTWDANYTLPIHVVYTLPATNTLVTVNCTVGLASVYSTYNVTTPFTLTHAAIVNVTIPYAGSGTCSISTPLGTYQYPITLNPELSVYVANNNARTEVGVPVNASLVISGGTPPYTVTPSNTTVVPTSAGTLTYTFTVRDAIGQTVSVPFNVVVYPKLSISASASSISGLLLTDPLAITFSVSGGLPPYSVAIYINGHLVTNNTISGAGTYVYRTEYLAMSGASIVVVARDALGVENYVLITVTTPPSIGIYVIILGTIFIIIIMMLIRHEKRVQAVIQELLNA